MVDYPSQPSINTFMNMVKQDPLFKELPKGVQESCEDLEIDNPVDLLKHLCLKASNLLKLNGIKDAKTILELAQRLAQLINDDSKAGQIIAWLGLIEHHEKSDILYVIEAIQTEVRRTPEFQNFIDTVLSSKES